MSESTPAQGSSLWERTREGVRDQVRCDALALFVEKGFDATTAADVAAAAGISQRTFFRYFATKEDVLISGSIAFGDLVRDTLEARPHDEPIWASLLRSFDPLVSGLSEEGQLSLDVMRVVMSTASLRAHHFEKHLAWAEKLVPVIEERLTGGSASPAIRAQTLAHTALACLDVALATWVANNGKPSLSVLLDTVFAQIADL